MLVSLYMHINSVLVEKFFNAVRTDNWDPDTNLHRRCTDTRIMVVINNFTFMLSQIYNTNSFSISHVWCQCVMLRAIDGFALSIALLNDRSFASYRPIVMTFTTQSSTAAQQAELHWLLPIDSAVGRRRKSVYATIDRTRGGANERSSENAARNNNTR